MARETFVHEATVEPASDANLDAIGAAITAELCGHWEHEPPCPWPHNNAVERPEPGGAVVRTVFIAEPGDEVEVRTRIDRALARGELTADEGSATWHVVRSGPRDARPDEGLLGDRLKR